MVHVEALAARSFTGAVDAAAKIAQRFGARVVTDRHAGAMVAERLRSLRVPVLVAPWAASTGPTATGKFEAYADMRTRPLRRRPAALGVWYRRAAPDRTATASALALAVAHCRRPPQRAEWLSEPDRLQLQYDRAIRDRKRDERSVWNGAPMTMSEMRHRHGRRDLW